MSEKERGIFDFVSKLKLDKIDDLMPKNTKEIPVSEVEGNEL